MLCGRWDEAAERLRAEEGKAELSNFEDGLLPLHVACLCGAPFHLVEVMLTEYPEAVKVVGGEANFLPLHFSCDPDRYDDPSPQVVPLLLDAYPDGAKATCRLGWLPLHYAASNYVPLEVLEMLVDAHPEGAAVCNLDGKLPIHYLAKKGAIEYDEDVESVRALLHAYPEGAEATDKDGQLPLHCAASRNAPFEIVEMLLNAHPEGAATFCVCGKRPIHYLAETASPENEDDVDQIASPDNEEDMENVRALLEPILTNEEALLRRHSDETPLHIAARFDVLRMSLHTCITMERCPASVVMTVARRHPEQLGERDGDGNYLLHLVAANPFLNGARFERARIEHDESSDDGDDESFEAVDDGGDETGGNDGGNAERDEAGVDGNGEANGDAEVEEDLISELVRLGPKAAAAARNADGRSPLCLAIESGKKWDEGVEAIADAAKHVVVTRDDATGLYPFMLAATNANSCLSTVFGLLRHSPELKRFMLD